MCTKSSKALLALTTGFGSPGPPSLQGSACDDNIDYGTLFARQYLDTPLFQLHARSGHRSKDGTIRSAINVHNNNAGRQIVEQTAKIKCSCYGLSGSCTTYICYKQVAHFHEIGQELYKKYSGAVKVRFIFTPTRNTKLAYMDDSPDFCKPNRTLGIQGTTGRWCVPRQNVTSPLPSTEYCETLCCGRGYTEQISTVNRPCNCNFQWSSLSVVCDDCTETVLNYICNS